MYKYVACALSALREKTSVGIVTEMSVSTIELELQVELYMYLLKRFDSKQLYYYYACIT